MPKHNSHKTLINNNSIKNTNPFNFYLYILYEYTERKIRKIRQREEKKTREAKTKMQYSIQ